MSRLTRFSQTRIAALLTLCFSLAAFAQTSATAPAADPSQVLARARTVMGFDRVHDQVLHLRAGTVVKQPFQSDRMYPPYLDYFAPQEIWFHPHTRLQLTKDKGMFPGSGPMPETTTLDDGINVETVRGDQHIPMHRRLAESRYLDAWAVIADWSASNDVKVAGSESYRDYPRTVLERHTPEGTQRLFLDPKTGYPVKLDFVEPHYLWGQRHVEYVWQTWIEAAGVSYPGAASRLVDGEVEDSRTNGDLDLVAAAGVAGFTAVAAPQQPLNELPRFLQPIPLQLTRVSDKVYLLANPGYREIAAEINGEIFLLDSTQGEARARLDEEAIQKLFPGKHKMNVVVTDLAWPHVSGVRYWVSQGATIISHRAGQTFLQSVIDRKWTYAPDTLEKKRIASPKSVKLNFVAVDQAATLAGGKLRLASIDGIASEVALMAFLPDDKFLWGSDFIQSVDSPTQYAKEVIAATHRAGFEPERVAAEHLPLMQWSDVLKAQEVKP